MTSQPTVAVPRRRSLVGLVALILGVLLVLLAGGVALYEKYVRHLTYHLTAFHPLVDGAAGLGVVLFLVGLALYLRRS